MQPGMTHVSVWTALVLACACAGEPTATHSSTNHACPPGWQAPCSCPGVSAGVQT
jgi:hypothetical protein